MQAANNICETNEQIIKAYEKKFLSAEIGNPNNRTSMNKLPTTFQSSELEQSRLMEQTEQRKRKQIDRAWKHHLICDEFLCGDYLNSPK